MAKMVRNCVRRLQINVQSGEETEFFKWFLACLLFGKPVQTAVAERAYRQLIAAHMTNPDAILKAGWDRLVTLLDQAHYVRYDYSTATKLLEVCRELKRRYGTVSKLLAGAKNASELYHKLQEFKHIGPVTAHIFLREVRPLFHKRSIRHQSALAA